MTIHESVTDDGVLELVMDNPKVNALPIADTLRLAEVLDGIRHRSDIRAVILTRDGAGLLCRGRHQGDAATPRQRGDPRRQPGLLRGVPGRL